MAIKPLQQAQIDLRLLHPAIAIITEKVGNWLRKHFDSAIARKNGCGALSIPTAKKLYKTKWCLKAICSIFHSVIKRSVIRLTNIDALIFTCDAHNMWLAIAFNTHRTRLAANLAVTKLKNTIFRAAICGISFRSFKDIGCCIWTCQTWIDKAVAHSIYYDYIFCWKQFHFKPQLAELLLVRKPPLTTHAINIRKRGAVEILPLSL